MKHYLLLASLASTMVMAQQTTNLQLVQSQAFRPVKDNVSILSAYTSSPLKTIKKGNKGELQLARTSDGRIVKQLIRDNAPMRIANQLKAPKATAAGSLYEDFSGWDGNTINWIPEDWSEINSNDEMATMNGGTYSWHVTDNSTGWDPNPVYGDYYAKIYFALDLETYMNLPQDEWLISPSFVPGEGELLRASIAYSPLMMFDLNLSIDWDAWVFAEKVIGANIEIYVSVEDGEWILLDDIMTQYLDDAYDLDTMFDSYIDTEWHNLAISLAEYAGKSIRVAFRYVGNGGDSVSIDVVRSSAADPVASYTLPQGALFNAFDSNYRIVSENGLGLMLLPAETPITWKNNSNEDSKSIEWYYYDPEARTVLTSTDEELTTEYPMGVQGEDNLFEQPTIFAYAGDAEDEYKWNGYAIQAGGNFDRTDEDGNFTSYPVSNACYHNYGLTQINYSADVPLFGFSDGSDAAWTSLFGTTTDLTAIANYFEQPLAPYTLSKIDVAAYGTVGAGAEFELNIYRVINGLLGDAFVTATCKGSDIVTAGDGKYLALPFEFDEVEIEDAILVTVSVVEDVDIEYIAFFQTSVVDENQTCNGYIMFVQNGQIDLKPISIIQLSGEGLYCSFFFNLYATYPALENTVAIKNVDNESSVIRTYNLAGQRTNANTTGIYLQQSANGSVNTVFVK